MKVAYWNVCNASSPEAIAERCQTMRDDGVDVFCLQEVPYTQPNNIPASAAIARTLKMGERFEHTRTLPGRSERIQGYGTAILTSGYMDEQFASWEYRQTPLSDSPKLGHQRRFSLVSRWERPEPIIGVAHLSYKLPFGIGASAMCQERTRLLAELESLASNNEVIFGGDLNCQSDDGLDEALTLRGYHCISPTNEPTFRSRHRYAGHIERNLDRVFVTSGVQATAELGDYGPSDHRPVIVSITT